MTAMHPHYPRSPRGVAPWSLALSLLAACGAEAPPPTGQDAPKDAAVPAVAPAPTERKVVDAAPATPLPVPAPVDPPAPVESPDDSPLHLAAKGNDLGLHPLVDGRLMVSVGPELMVVQPDGSFAHDPAMLAGLVHPRPPNPDNLSGLDRWYTVAAGGRWPDDMVLATAIESGFRGESERPVVYRRANGQWQAMNNRSVHYEWSPSDLHPWIEGSLLTRRVYQPYYRGQEQWEGEEAGPTDAQIRVADQAIAGAPALAVIRGAPKAPDLGQMRVAAFVSWASGDIVLVSSDARPDVVLAGPAGERSRVALGIAEGRALTVQGVTAATASDAYVFGWERSAADDGGGRPYLAHWDGTTASEVPPPACADGLASLARLADGTLWATCGVDLAQRTNLGQPRGLWHQAAGGTWTKQPTPEDWGEPRQLATLGDELWLATDYAVARAGVPKTVVALPSLAVISEAVYEYGAPIPVDRACTFALIVLPTPVDDAALVQAKLDAVVPASAGSMTVSLIKTTIREQSLLGVHVGMVEAREMPRLEKVVRGAVGPDVASARCYWAEATDENAIATWRSEP